MIFYNRTLGLINILKEKIIKLLNSDVLINDVLKKLLFIKITGLKLQKSKHMNKLVYFQKINLTFD
jgi:PP-loop superfamily ATP-utilizing enzyme